MIFGLQGAYEVGLISNHSIGNLFAGNSADLTLTHGGSPVDDIQLDVNGTATVDGAYFTLSSPAVGGRLNVQVNGAVNVAGTNNSPAELHIRNDATLVSGDATVGLFPAKSGIVGINGDETSWDLGNSKIAVDSASYVSVEQGAELASGQAIIGGSGTAELGGLVVSGVGSDSVPSYWTTLDSVELNRADILIEGGAVAEHVMTRMGISDLAWMEVKGTDSAGNPSHLSTGNFSMAQFSSSEAIFRVTDGATAESQSVLMGSNGFGRTEVIGTDASGSPSTWSIMGDLSVGSGERGVIVVDQGGHLSTTMTVLGRGSNSEAEGIVSLGGSSVGHTSTWQNTGDLYVGGDSTEAGGLGFVGVNEDSHMQVGGEIRIWNGGYVGVSGGKLSADTITHIDGGTFSMREGILEIDRFEGNLVNRSGSLSPGPVFGTTLIQGNYIQQDEAQLSVDIGGIIPGTSHDLVNITGQADIDGSLQLDFASGFIPSATDTFTVLAANSIIGSFDNVLNGQRLTTVDSGGSFIVNYGIGSAFDETRIILSDFESSAVLLGDVNRDGIVNLLDVQPFVDVLIGGGFQTEADINMDGVVSLLDVAPFVELLSGG